MSNFFFVDNFGNVIVAGYISVDGYIINPSNSLSGQVLQYNGTSYTPVSLQESDISNLVSDLAGKVSTSRAVYTDSTLIGGGTLSADRTLGIALGHANTWTGQQTFGTSATIFSAGAAATGSSDFDLTGSTGVLKTTAGTFVNTTNQLTLGTSSHNVIISSIAPAAVSNTLTIPDTSGADTFTFTTFTQTLANKTLTSPIINGVISSGSNAIDFSANSGDFKTSTGVSTFGGSSNVFTNIMYCYGGVQNYGAMGLEYAGVSTPYNVLDGDCYIAMIGSGARTINLPATSSYGSGSHLLMIQEVGNSAGTITINAHAGDNINGAASVTIAKAYGLRFLMFGGYVGGAGYWYASATI